jgi:hypothetical protein
MTTVDLDALNPDTLNDGDVALKNLVGLGASDAAERWADGGKLMKKLDFIRSHLGAEENRLIDNLLGKSSPSRPMKRTAYPPPSDDAGQAGGPATKLPSTTSRNLAKSSNLIRDSEDDTDDDDDERGRTAHFLFADLAGIDPADKENAWCFTSPPSDLDRGHLLCSGSSGGSKGRGRGGEAVRDGTWRLNCLTPISSPLGPSKVDEQKWMRSVLWPTSKLPPSSSVGSSPLVHTPVKNGHPKRGDASKTLPLASPFSLDVSSPLAATNPIRLLISNQTSSGSPVHGKHTLEPAKSLLSTSLARQAPLSKTYTRPKGKHPSRSFIASTPVRRQRPAEQAEAGEDPKKRRLNHNVNVALTEEIVLIEQIDRSGLLSRKSIDPVISKNQKSRELSPSPSSVPWVATEREHWHMKRLAMSEKVAAALPSMVQPSFWKKRERQVKQLERKTARRSGVGSGQGDRVDVHGVAPRTPEPMVIRDLRGLMPEPTLLSFETVHDEQEAEMDWNRSRMLVEAIREDVKKGRKPIIPPLQCAQSQSP